MKLQRVILLLLALLGFATFNCSYIGLATIKSADALVRYDLSEKGVGQTSVDDASRRVQSLDQSWTPVWWFGGSTSVFALLAFGLTFRSGHGINHHLQPNPR